MKPFQHDEDWLSRSLNRSAMEWPVHAWVRTASDEELRKVAEFIKSLRK